MGTASPHRLPWTVRAAPSSPGPRSRLLVSGLVGMLVPACLEVARGQLTRRPPG